jgi:hypothetical protein
MDKAQQKYIRELLWDLTQTNIKTFKALENLNGALQSSGVIGGNGKIKCYICGKPAEGVYNFPEYDGSIINNAPLCSEHAEEYKKGEGVFGKQE